ncbi:N-succinylglutamate 5-semialdehyde dehydrogenase [Frankliniella fusca]|uniref:N-succinylglutamate 5-semialdehyde dehydrogenase n=1 Tax=Frankliniella fusca TaxID=407009 RepID=A0AAE1LDL5_9NEOP|nr:N-succinylglutamate 5-semialdehyde dehydrogenase [Frankliniella fusca]
MAASISRACSACAARMPLRCVKEPGTTCTTGTPYWACSMRSASAHACSPALVAAYTDSAGSAASAQCDVTTTTRPRPGPGPALVPARSSGRKARVTLMVPARFTSSCSDTCRGVCQPNSPNTRTPALLTSAERPAGEISVLLVVGSRKKTSQVFNFSSGIRFKLNFWDGYLNPSAFDAKESKALR